jgi:hypothetical protein
MSIKDVHREKILSRWHALSQSERYEILMSIPTEKKSIRVLKSITSPVSKKRSSSSSSARRNDEDSEESLLTHADRGINESQYSGNGEDSHAGYETDFSSSAISLGSSLHPPTDKEVTVRCLLQVIACDSVSEDVKNGAQDRLVELLGIKKRKRGDSGDNNI